MRLCLEPFKAGFPLGDFVFARSDILSSKLNRFLISSNHKTKEKNHFARKKSPSGKPAEGSHSRAGLFFVLVEFFPPLIVLCFAFERHEGNLLILRFSF